MSRNLVVCCDGTWNRPKGAESTNVAWTYSLALSGQNTSERRIVTSKSDKSSMLEEKWDLTDDRQWVYYQVGVGTSKNKFLKAVDGATGTGIRHNIISAYRWLATHCSDGDQIYIFGFSRGAFCARSLAGMICRCGLLYPDFSSEADNVFEINRDRKKITQGDIVETLLNGKARSVDVHFLGVWDTVGALGIPLWGNWYNILSFWRNQFHDVSLSNHVRHARQALAMDEMRPAFIPTLWHVPPDRPKDNDHSVEQVWFRGVHSDIGGGYEDDRGLANITLQWMIEEAQKSGLVVDENLFREISDGCDPHGRIHDSMTSMWKIFGAWPRSFPVVNERDDTEFSESHGLLHQSVITRDSGYPAATGMMRWIEHAPVTISVDSRPWWDRTGVILRQGAVYEIDAEGKWTDKKTQCNADGWNKRNIAYWLLKRCRRKRDARWFSLIGLVNNAVDHHLREGSLWEGIKSWLIEDPPEFTSRLVTIGTKVVIKPEKSGMLYCFANDLWWAAWNNSGSVRLTIRRLNAVPPNSNQSRKAVDSATLHEGEGTTTVFGVDGDKNHPKPKYITDEYAENRLATLGWWIGFVLGVCEGLVIKQLSLTYGVLYALSLAFVGWCMAPKLASVKREKRVFFWCLFVILLVVQGVVIFLKSPPLLKTILILSTRLFTIVAVAGGFLFVILMVIMVYLAKKTIPKVKPASVWVE